MLRTVTGDFIDQDKTNNFSVRNYNRNPLLQSKNTRCFIPIRTRILVHKCDCYQYVISAIEILISNLINEKKKKDDNFIILDLIILL